MLIEGNTDPRFAAVREAFAQNFSDGLDSGAAAAVVLDGRLVVDLWGGHADAARARPWRADTLVNVWSVTKGRDGGGRGHGGRARQACLR